jgi:hypothetical protein
LPPSDASIMSCDPGSVISCPTGSHSAEDEKADATPFKRSLVTVSAQPGRPVPVPSTSAPANLSASDLVRLAMEKLSSASLAGSPLGQ